MSSRSPLSAALAAAATLLLGAPVQAQFSEHEIFFELNDTDGDLGIHANIDAEAYRRLEIEDPNETVILLVKAYGRLGRQGLTQLDLESAEPPFDELPPPDFFARFPEGVYELSAIALDGHEFEARDRLSHVLAEPVPNLRVNGQAAAASCDEPALPVVSGPVVIDWDPVAHSHPTLGRSGTVRIDRYQLFVEQGDVKFGVDLAPDVTEFEVPAAILAPGGTFKYEVIARTTTGNNTATESCFVLQ
jgi:hypothetical protein